MAARKCWAPGPVWFLLAALLCLAGACSSPETGSGPASAKKSGRTVSIRLAIPNPPGDELTQNAEQFAEAVTRETDGAWEVRVFPGETMVKVPETYDAVRQGSVEMSAVGIGIFEGLHPGLAEYPMSYDSIEANAAAAQPLLELFSAEIFEKHLNMKGLAAYTTGAQELISKKPVRTLEDWKGLLVGSGNSQGAALAKALGAAPVTVFWTDFYSALSKGTIDAALNSMRSDIVYRLSDSARHVSLFYGQPTFISYNINLDVWKSMPVDVQEIFLREARKACDTMNAYQIRCWKELDRKALQDLGVEIHDISPAERERWKKIVQPYMDKKLARLGDLGNRIRQIMDTANREHP